jgi:hypothetical protein
LPCRRARGHDSSRGPFWLGSVSWGFLHRIIAGSRRALWGVPASHGASALVHAETWSFALASRLGDETLTTLGRLPFRRVGVAALGSACHLAVSVGFRADLLARHGAGLKWGSPRTFFLPWIPSSRVFLLPAFLRRTVVAVAGWSRTRLGRFRGRPSLLGWRELGACAAIILFGAWVLLRRGGLGGLAPFGGIFHLAESLQVFKEHSEISRKATRDASVPVAGRLCSPFLSLGPCGLCD